MMFFVYSILIISILFVIWLYIKWHKMKKFWINKGIPQCEVHPIFGSLTFLQKINPVSIFNISEHIHWRRVSNKVVFNWRDPCPSVDCDRLLMVMLMMMIITLTSLSSKELIKMCIWRISWSSSNEPDYYIFPIQYKKDVICIIRTLYNTYIVTHLFPEILYMCLSLNQIFFVLRYLKTGDCF